MSELYRDFINNNMDDVITALNGTITPEPVNSELYRDFLNRKADDVITALNGTITPAPIGDELYRDFIERKFDDVIAGIGSYIPPLSFPTLTGSIVTFNSQYAGLPLKSHKIALTATQSGSGTPSPSNPRPISGCSVINISHSDADTSNPTVYTITIGSTVYGGEYDARSGVLTITHEIVDLATLSWVNDAANVRFYTRSIVNIVLPPPNNVTPIDGLCSHLLPVDAASLKKTPNCIAVGTSGTILVYAPDYTTFNDFLSAMQGAKLVYPLSVPQTMQLPPCPIDTLEGVNNIWTDTGDTTLQYIKLGGNT